MPSPNPTVYFKYFAELDVTATPGQYSVQADSFVVKATLQDYYNGTGDDLTRLGDISPDAFTAVTNQGTFHPRFEDKLTNGQGVASGYGGDHRFLYSAHAYTKGTILALDTGAFQIDCFLAGTSIAIERDGALVGVPVETLEVGDRVVTVSGARRPIRWLGHRTIDCRNHPYATSVHPIRVDAHAFGKGRPERDLYLSPGHPVLVGDAGEEGGHLVPIMCLINGTTIRRVAMEKVTYWHVELDTHDILLAEGLPAESYLEFGDRCFFDRGSEDTLANPDFVVPGLAGRCRPVAVEGPVVEAERARLDAVFAQQLTAACAWPDVADASSAI